MSASDRGVLRLAAFSEDPDGGNPAGVVLDAAGLSEHAMQQIATEVGYSETAFLTGPVEQGVLVPARFFAPDGEVPFCGHATVATAAALGSAVGEGRYELGTGVGTVVVEAGHDAERGRATGSFDSAPVGHVPIDPADLSELLQLLGWRAEDLHPDFAPGIGTAGNHHPVLVAAGTRRLDSLDYDFARLQRLCREREWITVQLVALTGDDSWSARDPFPYGGVVEDPATGSAAAAFVGYLRGHGRAAAGDRLVIEQGVQLGRPSRIVVTALEERARVAGPVTPIPG